MPSTTNSTKLMTAIAPTLFFRIVFLREWANSAHSLASSLDFHRNDAITTRHRCGFRKWFAATSGMLPDNDIRRSLPSFPAVLLLPRVFRGHSGQGVHLLSPAFCSGAG